MDVRALRGPLRHLAWIAALAIGLAGARVEPGAQGDVHHGALAPFELAEGVADGYASPLGETRFATPLPGLLRGGARPLPPVGPAFGAPRLADGSVACLSRRHLEGVRARPPPVLPA